MNPVEILKRNMQDEQRRAGMRKDCIVDTKALRQLLHDHELMDAYYRAEHLHEHHEENLNHMLYLVLAGLYLHKNRTVDTILKDVMSILNGCVKKDEDFEQSRRWDR